MAKSRKHLLLSKLFTVTLRILKPLVEALPHNVSLQLGRQIGYLASFLAPKDFKVAKLQIAAYLPQLRSLPSGERNARASKIARESFSHVGQMAVETLLLDRYFESKDNIEIVTKGETSPLDYLKQGRGIVAISGHIGSFELLAAAYTKTGIKGAAFGRKANYSFLNNEIEQIRNRYGLELLWREDRNTPRKLRKAINEGWVIIALIDQDTKLESVYAPFFGEDAASPRAPIKIAVSKELPVFSSFIIRTSNLKHQIQTEEIHYDCTTGENTEREILKVFNQRLEKLINMYPQQWLWWHKRWRRKNGVDYNTFPELLPATSLYTQRLELKLAASRKTS